jgi:hypothetical protein
LAPAACFAIIAFYALSSVRAAADLNTAGARGH